MELRHLRYFITVAEGENVSRAAQKLHLSQPGLSRQIRDLESELGFQLFTRTAKSLRLTDAGTAFLPEAKAVLARVEQGIKTARAIASGQNRELKIGYAPSLTVALLPQILRAFQHALPGVRATLHDLSTEEMISQLSAQKLDVALLARPFPSALRGLRFEELVRYGCRVAIAPGHPLARTRSISLAKITAEPMIAYSRLQYPEYYEFLDQMFADVKLKPQIAEEHDNVTSLITAVESGAGVALVPESMACFAGPRLKLLPISPAPKPIPVGGAWSKTNLKPELEIFLNCARAASKNAVLPRRK